MPKFAFSFLIFSIPLQCVTAKPELKEVEINCLDFLKNKKNGEVIIPFRILDMNSLHLGTCVSPSVVNVYILLGGQGKPER